MKKISHFIIPLAAVLCLASCDKGFEEKNQNPYALNTIEPGFLFTNAERSMNVGSWEGEQTIVQQFLNAYNTGATAGFNFNEDVDGYNTPRWNGVYGNVIKPLVQVLDLTKDDATRKNQYQMARIWKAYAFMTLVDTYGDVPYTEAGRGFLDNIIYPKYDKDEVIYDDLYNELKTATAALSTSNEYVKNDIFFGGAQGTSAALINAQVAQWKKIGYSLMLRLGMRYSKLNATKAASIVQEAFTGGVMQTNSDNVVVNLYSTANQNGFSNTQRTINPYFYYLAEPFVTFLKGANDPRLKYIGASYAAPQNTGSARDTITANQFGFPVGFDQTINTTKYPAYRGTKGQGQNYTQINYQVSASATAPAFFITNSQTQLLLAEAKFRGWITGGLTPQQYYEAGVRAAMDEWALFPGVQSPAITEVEKATYLRQPSVVWTVGKELQLINTQIWIESVTNGAEAFANWRRSGFPVLQPNMYNNKLNGGFVRRMAYPNSEINTNTASYNAAVASFGADNLTTRVFWDIP